MRLSPTLTYYFGRIFALTTATTMAGLVALVFTLDLIELLRRSANKESATFGRVLELAFLKLPSMMETMLPFAFLIGAMLVFTKLTRTGELVVARAAGVSVWQFLLPALALALIVGVLRPTLFNPISALLSDKYEFVEAEVLSRRAKLTAIADDGLWIRERAGDKISVLHAGGVQPSSATFKPIVVYLFTNEDQFDGRIDAASATLSAGNWVLKDARLTATNGKVTNHAEMFFETDLTLDNLQDSFVSPQSIGFWKLPGFIATLEKAGFSANRHQLHLHRLMSSPLLLCAMVLMAAVFSLRLFRQGGGVARTAVCLLFAFLFYFLSDIIYALGLSLQLPVVLAAWTPAVVVILIGSAGLLHLEDG